MSDPPKPIPSATGVFRGPMDDASFEADFEDLAARFSAQSGGGLSPELSAELALEIVLNEVVDQACLATGATGAAIALWRDGEMVCRASSGATAPELGVRLDIASGLSGACIQTQRTQRCDDALADLRVDIEASRRLGVRSVMVMPLVRGAKLAGVFELFSSQAYAFGDRDERTLEVLARRVVSNLEHAARPKPAPSPDVSQAYNPVASTPPQETVRGTTTGIVENSRHREFDSVTWALAAAVLACSILLGLAVTRDVQLRKASARPRPTASTTAATNASAVNPPMEDSPPNAQSSGTPSSTLSKDQLEHVDSRRSSPARTAGATSTLVGGLQVFDNGKEIFRMPAEQSQVERPSKVKSSAVQGTEMQRASSAERGGVVEISPAAAEGMVVHRVEPEYPETARQQKVQGTVVLNVRIGPNGAVRDVQVASGAPLLAQASSDAVKQWRFRPRSVDGHPVEMQTKVTLNFRLPK